MHFLIPFLLGTNAVVNACTPTAGGSDEFTLGDDRKPPLVKTDGRSAERHLAKQGIEVIGVFFYYQIGDNDSQLPVRRLVLNSRAVTQTANAAAGAISSGKCWKIVPTLKCRHKSFDNSGTTLSLLCTGNAADSAVILTYYNMTIDDIGSTFGSGQVTAMLDCTVDGQWAIGNVTNVAELECISS
uniref:C6 domain-containing protein n=1 Tax=Globodera rostochiensis TaxID=31243 RepID=A0A914I3W9_GLORO